MNPHADAEGVINLYVNLDEAAKFWLFGEDTIVLQWQNYFVDLEQDHYICLN